jgi:glycosyltransferase involved in cell wall biosynthesis
MKKVLIVTYYWPPSGGSGVQRWMYFARYLSDFGVTPYVLTVNESEASYKTRDESFRKQVEHVKTFRTSTFELIRFYSKITTGDPSKAIPVGFAGDKKHGPFQKFSRYIRGNFFIPDARIGWNKYALRKAREIIRDEKIDVIITTGPPHSTHLIGLKLKQEFAVPWIADFRDPWTEVYYNSMMYRSARADKKDKQLESNVLENADVVLTVGPSMKQLLQDKLKKNREKVHAILNGYDAGIFKGLQRTRTDRDTFIIAHIGVLGEMQPITAFLKAVSRILQESPQLEQLLLFRIIGNVSAVVLEEVRNITPRLKLEVISYVPHKEALSHMMNADLLLNSLAETPGSKLLISGKLMEYIASGRAILALGDPEGDAAILLQNMKHACVLSRKDEDGIRLYLENIISEWKAGTLDANRQGIEKYSRYELTRELAGLINSVG